MRRVEGLRPGDADELHRFVELACGVRVVRRGLIDGNDAPFDYLLHSFFEGGDAVVWASRGGGKSYLGAAATLLDLLFKPGIEVRILSGSVDQAGRMYGYLRGMVEAGPFRGLVDGRVFRRGFVLVNGSRVELLSQSERSVRGQRVHKLRCDEVELFDEGVWEAAQRVTRSGVCGGVEVCGAVEVFSTMHAPFGLMSRVVDLAGRSGERKGGEADSGGEGGGEWGGEGGVRLLRWSALDVIERCPEARACEGCRLWGDCGGRAKGADGFVRVDDLVRQRRRSSDGAWASEMMCERPVRGGCVYPGFDPEEGVGHVGEVRVVGVGECEYVVGGMDFGIRGGVAMLWGRVDEGGVLGVFGEYYAKDLTLGENLECAERLGWPRPAWWGVDPAGNARNSQTGLRDVDVLRRRGERVRFCRSRVKEGIEAVRYRLEKRLLVIDPRCRGLIEAMTRYHFDPKYPHREEPVKDGPDHACDALRYMVLNLDRRGGEAGGGRYL